MTPDEGVGVTADRLLTSGSGRRDPLHSSVVNSSSSGMPSATSSPSLYQQQQQQQQQQPRLMASSSMANPLRVLQQGGSVLLLTPPSAPLGDSHLLDPAEQHPPLMYVVLAGGLGGAFADFSLHRCGERR